MHALTLNGMTPITDLRIASSWRGPLELDLEIDLDPSAALPSGKVTVNVFDTDVIGTVDPSATSRFADRVRLRVIGGANGWNQTVTARDFADDDGVGVDTIINATAADVGETIAEVPTTKLGPNYPRSSGVASRVLAGLDWYVSNDGQTHVASRPASTPPDDAEALTFDPLTRTLTIGVLDSLILPGMQFTDTNGRWSGTLTARDVEQHFTADGDSTAIVSCGADATDQGVRELLERFVREVIGLPYLKTYRYRIVTQNPDGRLQLQAVDKAPGLPDALPIPLWPGIPGVSAKYSLDGAIVRLAFLDPSRPIVVSHDPSFTPLELHFNAQTLIELGANAPSFAARGDALQAIYAALLAFAGAGPFTTIPQITTAFGTLLTALTPPAFTTPCEGVLVKVK
ncbi:MAG TPA: hypothetical protein VGH28_10565 [Polyangiaceae bacterium]|jgi:hypothetical protein